MPPSGYKRSGVQASLTQQRYVKFLQWSSQHLFCRGKNATSPSSSFWDKYHINLFVCPSSEPHPTSLVNLLPLYSVILNLSLLKSQPTQSICPHHFTGTLNSKPPQLHTWWLISQSSTAHTLFSTFQSPGIILINRPSFTTEASHFSYMKCTVYLISATHPIQIVSAPLLDQSHNSCNNIYEHTAWILIFTDFHHLLHCSVLTAHTASITNYMTQITDQTTGHYVHPVSIHNT